MEGKACGGIGKCLAFIALSTRKDPILKKEFNSTRQKDLKPLICDITEIILIRIFLSSPFELS